MTGIYLLVWGAALAAIVFAARRAFWQARYREALDEPTQELDIVDAAFADYRRSISDLLDEHPERSEELIEGLEAATDRWVRDEFRSATAPLRRDLRFRLAMHRAAKTKTTHP